VRGERDGHPCGVQQLAPLLPDDDGHGEGGVRGGELAAHDEHRVDVATARERRREGVRVTVGSDSKLVKLTTDGVKEFRNENETSRRASSNVEMRLDTTLQYEGRSPKCPLVGVCPLQLQHVDPVVAATALRRTKCTILRAKKSGC
jgi:hypothetical protein